MKRIEEPRFTREVTEGLRGRRLAVYCDDLPLIRRLVNQLGINYYWHFYTQLCTSRNLPYHNFYHTRCMLLNVIEGYCVQHNVDAERLLLRKSAKKLYELRAISVGAILHDYDHSGGLVTDDINVKLARKMLLLAQETCPLEFRLSDAELELADACIAITKYPYDRDPEIELEMIIRDADLMQIYEEDVSKLRRQYLGLKSEIELARGVTFTNEEYAAGQVDWLKTNVHWYSAWAIEKAEVLDWNERVAFLGEVLRKAE